MDQINSRTAMPNVYADREALEQNDEYAKAYRNARASLELHLSATSISETSDALGEVNQKLSQELTAAGPECSGSKGKVYLTLIQRVCAGQADCKEFRLAPLTYLRGERYADRFDLLLRWAYAYRADEKNPAKAQYAKGLLQPNLHVLVGDLGAVSPPDGSQVLDNFRAETTPASDEVVQANLERMVRDLRLSRPADVDPNVAKKIPAQLLRALNVPQQVYVRLADSFAYAEGLPESLGSKPEAVLLAIPDRMAEARLAECVLNKRVHLVDANGAANLAALKTCTGYTWKDLAQVTACVPGAKAADSGLCAPKLDAAVVGEVLKEAVGLMQLGTYVRDARSLATTSLLGRLPNLKYADFAVAAKKCVGVANDAAGAECLFNQQFKSVEKDLQRIQKCAKNSSGSKLAECLAVGGFGKEEARLRLAAKCAIGSNTALAECGTAGLLDNETQRRLSCVREKSDATARAACIAEGLPGADIAAKFTTCANRPQEQRLSCLGALPGMPAKIVQSAVECQRATGSLAAGAACARALGVNIPPGVDTLVGCAGRPSTAGMLACAADGKVGGDAGKVLSCASQANFDGPGTGACVVGTMLKFNEDLMMAATCVASTGGEPTTAAVCTFGKLAMREFEFCKNDRFGEGKCFGKNNTLVKLFNIGPNSTVAQVLNIQMDMYKGMIAFTQNPGKAVGDFVRNAGRELTIVRENVLREAEAFHDNLRREASKVLGKGIYIKVKCCRL
ncbi:hypothetical protein QTI24_21570 [Variovorax sp. J22P240]|uniref:hypothetical protein n=1 Tax=Variovorax sp. J22P240 TaxID=3053514 RepID=UPI002575DFC4|nr:hypothetical protein [Variovorax sp. J22P240]MDM0001210.1 hypothetical protein [Variovorax sp. J22P240]